MKLRVAVVVLLGGIEVTGPAQAKLLGIGAVDGRCPCATRRQGQPWASHEAYVGCVRRAADRIVRAGSATAAEGIEKIATATTSSCGEPGRRCRYVRRPCAAGTTCEHPGLSQRYLATWVGICLEPPAACGTEGFPVCGVDGGTYASDCERQRAGVEKQFKGECPQRCGGPEHVGCPDGEVCDCLARCGGGEWGQCITRPTGCTPSYGPYGAGVRGCDGTTYPSICEAWELGVTVRSGKRRWPDYGARYCVP